MEDSKLRQRLEHLRSKTSIEELMYLSTCNRVEFVFTSHSPFDDDCLLNFFLAFDPNATETQLQFACQYAECYEGMDAVRHLFKVASSIDSLVLGEREIITQVRTAYENCQLMGFTGDMLRLLIGKTVEAAKAVYTQTNVATKPVSIVSLAYRKLKDLNLPLDSRVLVIGAGKTNSNMCKFLHKHGFTNFTVFNRTIRNGDRLAATLGCESLSLNTLPQYMQGFDLIVTCTASSKYIFTKELYHQLLQGDTDRKVVIDLAIPNDFDRSISDFHKIKMIAVEDLRTIADKNLREREKELVVCERIIQEYLEEFRCVYKERQVELAMKSVPNKVKEIKDVAINSVFASDLANLDDEARAVIDKMMSYMEKKYISVPMKMAKEILLDNPEQPAEH